MSTERALRVSQSIKRELADMLRRDLKDPRLSGLISFTEVECTSDLRNVKVFVSVFGTAQQPIQPQTDADAPPKLTPSGQLEMTPAEKATHGVLGCLNEESGYIRGELCRRLKLRFAPELQFLPDISLERGSKVSEILAKISRGEV
ncbi:MAG: ribosome-binding factor A [Cyanobacteria bacterium SZAS LIN-2]|nr:ribosome-binding factor A [Cyanobacteria bacterium SZAS LIN-3]MBS1996054.1 ribosome-binding factor A [Cyanobacteria bacterium SZAS LIN-2]MBS2008687.1 ribosome-binding factor A [Cyanobacteria bacterium SZAS TMP-1]